MRYPSMCPSRDLISEVDRALFGARRSSTRRKSSWRLWRRSMPTCARWCCSMCCATASAATACTPSSSSAPASTRRLSRDALQGSGARARARAVRAGDGAVRTDLPGRQQGARKELRLCLARSAAQRVRSSHDGDQPLVRIARCLRRSDGRLRRTHAGAVAAHRGTARPAGRDGAPALSQPGADRSRRISGTSRMPRSRRCWPRCRRSSARCSRWRSSTPSSRTAACTSSSTIPPASSRPRSTLLSSSLASIARRRFSSAPSTCSARQYPRDMETRRGKYFEPRRLERIGQAALGPDRRVLCARRRPDRRAPRRQRRPSKAAPASGPPWRPTRGPRRCCPADQRERVAMCAR